MTRKKTKKIKVGGLIVIILFIYLIITFGIYLWKMPIKNIYIDGNYYLKDNYIINYLDIENKPILQISKKSIKNKLLELDLISDAKIRKNILGKLYINVTEDKVLFYNWNNKKLVLSSGKEVPYNKEYLGIPNLINYVKEDVYKDLILKLQRVDKNILSLVSEMEYSPSEINGKIVDDKRFLFRMNDGNKVYINTINIEKINNYIDIYNAIKSKNENVVGCLYLDSNSENKHFGSCDVKEEMIDSGEN